MSLTSSVQRIVQAKADIKTAIEAKGVTVGNDVSIADYDDYVAQITTGSSTPTQTKTVALSMANGDQVITPDTGYTLSQVTVEKPATLIPTNIVSGVTIGGVTGTASSGGGGGDIDTLINGSITSVESNVATVKDYCFYGCTGLTTISFPNATNLGSNSFYGCTGLTSINFPEVVTVQYGAFNECSNLASITLPKVTTMGQRAFQNCKMSSVSFTEVTSIGDYCFNGCSSLTSASMSKLTSIGQYAFQNCKLTSASFPLVTTMGQRAFTNMTTLTSASFPELTVLEQHTFYACNNLGTLVAPKLTSIANFATYNCPFSTLRLEHTSVVSLLGTSNFKSNRQLTVQVPANLVDSYKTATNWNTLFNNGKVTFVAIS